MGGAFTLYRNDLGTNTAAAPRVAKVDLTTGNLDMVFTQSVGFDSTVNTLAVSSTALFAGGSFATYRNNDSSGTIAAANFAKLALDTGHIDTSWGSFNDDVNAIVVSADAVFVGGRFTSYGGSVSFGLAKLALATGAIDAAWISRGVRMATPLISPQVDSLWLDGSSLYVHGQFDQYREGPGTTLSAGNLVRVSASTNVLDAAFSRPVGPSGTVDALALSHGRVYLGGSFRAYRGTPQASFAKLDLTTWRSDATFAPNFAVQGPVKALAVTGTSLYLGGGFDLVSPSPVPTIVGHHLSKVDLVSGALDTTFTRSIGPSDGVETLLYDQTSIYLGGSFTTYRNDTSTGTLPAVHLAKVNYLTGNLDTTFNKSIGINSSVLALDNDGTNVYAGGSFTTYRNDANNGTLPAQNLAGIGLATGNLDQTFTQATGCGSVVYGLEKVTGALYAGGNFTTYRTSGTAVRLAKITLPSGALDLTFTRSMGADGRVHTIAASTAVVYIGGFFSNYRNDASDGMVPAVRIAKLDATTGNLITSFAPGAGTEADVHSIFLAPIGNTIYVGTSFNTFGGEMTGPLVALDTTTGALK